MLCLQKLNVNNILCSLQTIKPIDSNLTMFLSSNQYQDFHKQWKQWLRGDDHVITNKASCGCIVHQKVTNLCLSVIEEYFGYSSNSENTMLIIRDSWHSAANQHWVFTQPKFKVLFWSHKVKHVSSSQYICPSFLKYSHLHLPGLSVSCSPSLPSHPDLLSVLSSSCTYKDLYLRSGSPRVLPKHLLTHHLVHSAL